MIGKETDTEMGNGNQKGKGKWEEARRERSTWLGGVGEKRNGERLGKEKHKKSKQNKQDEQGNQ